MDVRYVVLPNGELRCFAVDLLSGWGWHTSVQMVKVWAWLRNLHISRWRRQGDVLAFHAWYRPSHIDNRFQTACLCGWSETAPNMALMVLARADHRRNFLWHFSTEKCLHNMFTTKDSGAVSCVDCKRMLGWDALRWTDQVDALLAWSGA